MRHLRNKGLPLLWAPIEASCKFKALDMGNTKKWPETHGRLQALVHLWYSNMAGWEIPNKWRFISWKIIEIHVFSLLCLVTKSRYPSPISVPACISGWLHPPTEPLELGAPPHVYHLAGYKPMIFRSISIIFTMSQYCWINPPSVPLDDSKQVRVCT